LPETKHIATGGAAAWLGAVHLLVDAATVSAVLRSAPPAGAVASSAFAFVLGYDLLAFAGQLPLGALLDRWRVRRLCATAGVVLAMAAVFAVGEGSFAALGFTTLLLAGLGNALFHVGAGAMVLDGSGGEAAPAGVFVAPGALGLGLGLLLGRSFPGAPLWPLHLALGAAAVLCFLVPSRAVEEPMRATDRRSPAAAPGPRQITQIGETALLLSLLFLSVFVRAFVGAVACDGCPKGLLLVCGVAVAGFLGKAAGGYLADRLGFADLAVVALVSSAPLLGYSRGSLPTALAGLVLLQLTMPVTLAAVYRLSPRRPAAGFGFLCVALVLGVAAAQWPGMRRPHGLELCLLILASAAALYVALRRLARAPARPELVSVPPTVGEVS
jgi:FSR family fosmidomycin resistance protein-like MFS transporter